ncbi:type IV pilus assembly protein PilM [Desulfoplanes formicivorans]|uniref:Pilus assembly protein PilM n=1 Tax=Desulfoplanes formicivorans TaxID=1592317 RepID=A0A194AHW8_9BACT|nr:type IV pilus assembly protein PilM [Desulfoplanes formicivorans]GAU09672.1 pilus assembly protein PilM [Desulfoplanes formicivorans]
MIPFLHKKTTACGLDLGTSWLKMICLRKGRQGVRLERVGHMNLPLQSKGDAKAVGAAAKALHTSMAFKDKVVISSLRGHEIIVKHMQLPLAKDMRAVVEKEAREQIPFDLADLYLDFHCIDPPDKKAKKADVMVVATKKKVVMDLEATLEVGGLSLSVVDVDAFALSNCFEFNYPEQTQPAYLLDIGATQSILGVYEPHRPFYFRELGFGGQQITQTLARQLDIPLGEAEALKLEGPESLSSAQREQITRAIRERCRDWCREIKRVEQFFQTSTSITSLPKTLHVSGGGSLLAGLLPLLAHELDMEVSAFDPWRTIHVDSNQFDSRYIRTVGPQFAIPTGLALRGCQ